MKHWKGRTGTTKEGQFGTMDDNGTVPDSESATLAEYEAFIATQPAPPPDALKEEYQAATNDAQRINVIAKKLKFV